MAQPAPAAIDEFGTQDGIDLWIPATQFSGVGVHWATDFGGDFYFISSGAGEFKALLPLPQGALWDSWRAFFYDGSSTNDFSIQFYKVFDDTTGTPDQSTTDYGSFTSSGTPGHTNHHFVEGVTIDLREPSGPGVTRAEAADLYAIKVTMPDDPLVAFKGVRVIWHRQVSPAPATATFNDVPASDTGFQYIEALVASGITAGCGGGNYCPDATLTRRQMAVFLSKALGLHWPNR
jgi:hypothetical protein